MRRALALVLLLGIGGAVLAVGNAERPTAALAFGLALIAAALVGDLFERLHLPRLTGYLAFGVACGPFAANLISAPMARELQIVNGLAIALIAFVAGLEINVARLRPRLPAFVRFGAVLIGTVFLLLFVAAWTAWPWLPILPAAQGGLRVALAALLATLVISFSPTVTIAVLADARARGPLSELVVALVVLGDLAIIVAFTVVMPLVRWAIGDGGTEMNLVARLAWDIGGSLAFGALLGGVFALFLKLVAREVTLALLGLCAVASASGPAFHFEPLLVALAAGLVVENVAAVAGDALRDAVEHGALPVLVVFFTAAGASLQLDALASIGVIAAAVSVTRFVAIRIGAGLGLRASGLPAQPAGDAWMGLVSQAGVTLGMTVAVAAAFADWGARVQTLMVALIAIHETVGPVLFRRALARADEIGRASQRES
jgi:Kef-type K+ transport system membrane component KefB